MRNYLAMFLLVVMNWCGSMLAQPQCTVTHYDEFSGMAQWWVTQILQDKQGMIWISTWNGLNRFDGYEFECFKSQAGDGVDVPSDRIMDMMLMDDGSLRCYVEGRILGFSTKTCKYFEISETEERQLKKKFATAHQREMAFESKGLPNYYKDVYGTEWTIGQQGGLKYKDQATGQYKDYPADWHGADRIRFCLADKEGNAWFTSSYGAFKLSFHKQPYQKLEQVKPVQVRYSFLDKKQRYWITTRDDATIRLFDRKNHELGYLGADGRLHAGYTSFGSPIYHIFQDSRGTIWLCSKPYGLFRLRETADGVFSVEHFVHHDDDSRSLSNNELYYATEDNMGRLWIANFRTGIDCVTNPQAEHPVFIHVDKIDRPSKDAQTRSRQLHITRQNILLAATTTGLLVADISPKDPRQIVFKRHTKDIHRSNSLSSNATMFITEDSKQRIFVCTESGGVNQILSDNLLAPQLEFRHFNTSTGLPSDVALSAVSYHNQLLVVSNNQLILLDPDVTEKTDYKSFFLNEKLRFSDAVPLMLPDGRGLFGLQNGAFTIRKEDVGGNRYIPPMALTALIIENKHKMRGVNTIDTLTLEPSQRSFQLRFAALEYSDASQISYAFRMGEHASWNHIGKDRSATFLDLKPGTYQLQIRSTNCNGLWVDNIRTLTVIVKPTFWETRWAQLLYALLLVMFVWGVLYLRHYIIRMNRRQKELHEAYLALLNNKTEKTVSAPSDASVPSKPQMKPEDEAFMQRAIQFIEEHLGDADINIGDMADATATSRSGLNRKMKSLLGVTPLDFIREARIRKACQMLKDGASVNDVAYSCGFSDPKYFGKCFKADMGMTPKEYKVEYSVK